MSDGPLIDWGLNQIKTRGWEGYLLIGFACMGVGVVIGWCADRIKTKVEIAKVKEEARKASGDNVEKLAQLRATANSKRQVLDMTKQNMRDALLANQQDAKNVDHLRLCRDEMCNVYQNEYLPAASTYVELIPRLVDRREALIRAETELVPGLETICGFLDIGEHGCNAEENPSITAIQGKQGWQRWVAAPSEKASSLVVCSNSVEDQKDSQTN